MMELTECDGLIFPAEASDAPHSSCFCFISYSARFESDKPHIHELFLLVNHKMTLTMEMENERLRDEEKRRKREFCLDIAMVFNDN